MGRMAIAARAGVRRNATATDASSVPAKATANGRTERARKPLHGHQRQQDEESEGYNVAGAPVLRERCVRGGAPTRRGVLRPRPVELGLDGCELRRGTG